MSVGMVMRSSRLRTLLYALVLCGMGLVVVLLSNTHSRLKNVENSNEKCQQQRDSLSAQLQVVYEHKNRIEKSLDQERTDHKHAKEEVEKQSADLKARHEKDKLQMESRYNDLHQEHQLLQKKVQQLEAELSSAQESNTNLQQQKKQLQEQISSLVLEKEHLQHTNLGQSWKVKQCMEETEVCRVENQHLQQRLASLSSHKWPGEHLLGKDMPHVNPGGDPNMPIVDLQKPEDESGKLDVRRQEMQEEKPKHDKGVQVSPLNHSPRMADEKANHIIPGLDQNIPHVPGNKDAVPQGAMLGHENSNKQLQFDSAVVGDNKNAAGNIRSPQHQDSHGAAKQNHLPQVQPPLGFDGVQQHLSDNLQEDTVNNGAGEKPLGQPLPMPNRPAESNYGGHQELQQQDLSANNLQNVLARPPDAINGDQHQWQAGNEILAVDQQANRANAEGKNALMEGLKRGPQFVGQQQGARAKGNPPHQQGDDDNADDQEAENAHGMGIGAGGGHPFRDADFDDQDDADGNAQNPPHQEKEEGVMVAPK